MEEALKFSMKLFRTLVCFFLVLSVGTLQPVGCCSSSLEVDFTLSRQCFCSSVSSSKATIVGNMKMQRKAVLVFFFLSVCWFIFREIWISFRGLQFMYQSVYWRFKDRKIRATKTRKKLLHFPKPAKPLNG